jgi:hypothetical protein
MFDRPFFPGSTRWQGQRLLEFLKTASDGFSIAAEQLSEIPDAAVPEFAGFDGGIETTIAFAETMEDLLHGLFDIERVGDNHGGILPAGPRFPGKSPKLPPNSRAQNPKWGS